MSIGWLVKDLSAGSGVGGLLVLSASAINTLPGLVVNPLAGVLGDRLDRRKLVIIVQLLAGLLALAFAFLVASPTSDPGTPTPMCWSPAPSWPSPSPCSRC